jgi:hypothetical protein
LELNSVCFVFLERERELFVSVSEREDIGASFRERKEK